MPSKIKLSSKITLLFLALLLVFLGRLKYQQYKNRQAIDKEKSALQRQISDLAKKNQDLSDSLSYLGSVDFKQRMARQQLNLKKDGEIVFGFSDNTALAQSGQEQSSQNTGPDYEKWVEYFFGNN